MANDPPLNHSRRSWIDNGVHYTMESASYTSPGFSFSTGGMFNTLSSPEERTARAQAPGFGGSGLLGNAINLLSAMGDMRHASRPRSFHDPNRERHARFEESDDESGYEDDLAYGEIGDGGTRSHRRSMFSRLKDRLNDNRQRTRKAPYSREASPAQRPRRRRQPSYREEHHQQAYTDVAEEDADYEVFGKSHQQTRPRPRTSDDSDMLQALQHTVDHHQVQVRRSRKNLERASRRQDVDIGILQALLNQVKSSERSLAAAEQNLQAEKRRVGRAGGQRSEGSQASRPWPRNQSSPTPPDNFDGFFTSPGFGGFSGQPRAAHPLFPELDDFHTADPFAHIFGGVFQTPFDAFSRPSPFENDLHNLFGIPSGTHFAGVRNKRPRFSSANGGPRSQPGPGFAAYTPAPPQRPPPTLLQPGEAESLFRTYNDRWNALAPTDPNIPYPTRGLKAPALLALDTLWAPTVSSPITTWSEESIMQANVQAFYLGVVGLMPQYNETGGRVTMGFDKTRASPAQIKQLVDMLKKEKARWHSDRLGRRNGENSGPNQALQNNPRARAVFHAVCELMETAQHG